MTRTFIARYINSNGLEEDGGNTPDFILADLCYECGATTCQEIVEIVTAFGNALAARQKWCGEPEPVASAEYELTASSASTEGDHGLVIFDYTIDLPERVHDAERETV